MHSVVVFSKGEGTDPLALVFVTGSIDGQCNSPVPTRSVSPHRAQTALLFSSCLFSSFSAITPLSTHSVSPCPGRLGARHLVVFALHFQMTSVSFLMIPVMLPAWGGCCSVTISHSFLSYQGFPLPWSTHSSERLKP